MRRTVAGLLAISTALSAGLAACFDLFHSTADVVTACAIDASARGCFDVGAGDGAVPDAGATDLCTATPMQARLRAQHACAWLGACESPMGRNAFGDCMFQALLAYDCEANPNHPARGKARSLWDCLWKVKTCGDVDSCVVPDGPARCELGASYTACGIGSGAPISNADVRFECAADGGPSHPNAYAENCALWGKTCASTGAGAVCAGSGGLGCSAKECVGRPRAQLHWCIDGGDLGVDCASGGGQFCVGFFSDASEPWLACAAESDAGACSPDPSATCSNGVATSCPSGLLETIDCASILQSATACEAGALAPPFDWTSPCAIVPARCSESCNGTLLTGCARGAPFTLDCTAVDLGPCRMVTTDVGAAQHAACTPR